MLLFNTYLPFLHSDAVSRVTVFFISGNYIVWQEGDITEAAGDSVIDFADVLSDHAVKTCVFRPFITPLASLCRIVPIDFSIILCHNSYKTPLEMEDGAKTLCTVKAVLSVYMFAVIMLLSQKGGIDDKLDRCYSDHCIPYMQFSS